MTYDETAGTSAPAKKPGRKPSPGTEKRKELKAQKAALREEMKAAKATLREAVSAVKDAQRSEKVAQKEVDKVEAKIAKIDAAIDGLG